MSKKRDVIVPRAREHRGFSAGYWLRAVQGDVIGALQIFDTEANALATAEPISVEGAPTQGTALGESEGRRSSDKT